MPFGPGPGPRLRTIVAALLLAGAAVVRADMIVDDAPADDEGSDYVVDDAPADTEDDPSAVSPDALPDADGPDYTIDDAPPDEQDRTEPFLDGQPPPP